MSADRTARIEAMLTEAFSPDGICLSKIKATYMPVMRVLQEGQGHFEVIIVADAFDGCSRIESHRLIYEALGELMTTDIHALSIRASARNPNRST